MSDFDSNPFADPEAVNPFSVSETDGTYAKLDAILDEIFSNVSSHIRHHKNSLVSCLTYRPNS